MAKTQELSKRKYFTKINDIDVPDLLEHQKRSWREFVQEGLSEIFAEVNPISDYTGAKLDVSFKSYFLVTQKLANAKLGKTILVLMPRFTPTLNLSIK